MSNQTNLLHTLDRVKQLVNALAEHDEQTNRHTYGKSYTELTNLIHDLAEARDVAARDYFLIELTSGIHDIEVRIALVNALGFHWTDFKEPAPIFAAILANKCEDESLRGICAAALGALTYESAVPLLVDIVTGFTAADMYVRRSAVAALTGMVNMPYANRKAFEESLEVPKQVWFEGVQDLLTLSKALGDWFQWMG
jgi:HEAT repeat protein